MAIRLLVLTLLLVSCSGSLRQETVLLPPQTCVDSADRVYEHKTSTPTLECALQRLRTNADAQQATTAARICFLLADRTADQEAQETFAAEGVGWAERALKGKVSEGIARYYLSVNLGIAVRGHVRLALGNLSKIAYNLTIATELEPTEDQGGPLRVLGMLYLRAPAWPNGIGDGDKAVELLRRAATEHPEHPQNHIYLARALWDVEEEDALEEVERHLRLGREKLAGEWGSARARWNKELEEIAAEAGVQLDFNASQAAE